MKKYLLVTLFSVFGLVAFNSHASSMSCTMFTQGGSVAQYSGGCFGFDYSFGRGTTATYSINAEGETILNTIWIEGCSAPNGAMSCQTYLPAYSSKTARAILILPPGDRFKEVSATAQYETGF